MFLAAVVAEELEVPAPEGSPNADDPMSTGPYDPLTPAECSAATPALKRFRKAGEAVAGSGGVGWYEYSDSIYARSSGACSRIGSDTNRWNHLCSCDRKMSS